MLAALAFALGWLLGVSVEVRLEGPSPAGHAVSAGEGAARIEATTDAEGRARLDVAPGARCRRASGETGAAARGAGIFG